MKKLTLQVEDLEIDSFATDDATQNERGTVHGREDSLKVICVSTLKTDMTCCPCTPAF